MRFKLLLLLFFPLSVHALPGYTEPWGKDAGLKPTPPPAAQNLEHSLAVEVAKHVILFHQNVLSQVDGPRSHFRPSSSSYMLQSMQKHGFVMGFFMGCDRLMRENSDDWVYRTIEENGKLIKFDPIR